MMRVIHAHHACNVQHSEAVWHMETHCLKASATSVSATTISACLRWRANHCPLLRQWLLFKEALSMASFHLCMTESHEHYFMQHSNWLAQACKLQQAYVLKHTRHIGD